MAHGTGYVRIPTSSLFAVKLRHLASAKDMTIGSADGSHSEATITGYTEWVGTWQGMAISIGWDWAVVGDMVVVLNPNEIRTNIRLVAPAGEDEPTPRARIHLLDWIESIPWREVAIKDLDDDDSQLS